MDTHYLVGYIRDDEPKGDSLEKWTEKWERDIRIVTETADKYLQESFATEAHAIQS